MPVFTGLPVRQLRRLVRIVAGRGGAQTGTGRRWSLPLADRMLLIAVCYRTNLALRQVALLFGVSKSAAHRVVDHLAPLLALAPVTRRHSPDTVLVVDGTLVPVHDRTVTASSKKHRYSANMQVVIDAKTRLMVAVGRPVPGNHNDCTVFRDSGADTACRGAHVMADGGYQGNQHVIMPYRRPRDGSELPTWQHELNTVHKRVRARVEHARPGDSRLTGPEDAISAAARLAAPLDHYGTAFSSLHRYGVGGCRPWCLAPRCGTWGVESAAARVEGTEITDGSEPAARRRRTARLGLGRRAPARWPRRMVSAGSRLGVVVRRGRAGPMLPCRLDRRGRRRVRS